MEEHEKLFAELDKITSDQQYGLEFLKLADDDDKKLNILTNCIVMFEWFLNERTKETGEKLQQVLGTSSDDESIKKLM